MPSDDLQFELLRQLNQDPAASQRSLAARYGVSLGKVNYCLRALVGQGLIKANNFRRSDSKLAYAYVLTPAGIDEKAKLAKAFLQRKVAEFEQIQREIHDLRIETSEGPAIGTLGAADPQGSEMPAPEGRVAGSPGP